MNRLANLARSVRELPSFKARRHELEILHEPDEFYDRLLRLIAQSRERITLASLYIGKEETALFQALDNALRERPTLKLNVLLDYFRATREAPMECSASKVKRLVERYPQQVDLRLWRTPEMSLFTERLLPKRFNEGWGLQHLKVYGFDDSVMISGANLSSDYFTNRQDRYWLWSHKEIADYFFELVELIGRWSVHNDQTALKEGARSPEEVRYGARFQLSAFTSKWAAKHPSPGVETPLRGAETMVVPLLQMGPLQIRHEEAAVLGCLEDADERGAMARDSGRPLVAMTSGYFSLYKKYRDRVLANRAAFDLLAAAPEANGFYQSKGVSRFIPPAYTYAEAQFLRDVDLRPASGDARAITLSEWSRPDWTYHAKGIWYCPESKRGPLLSFIGSSNYGARSANRDLEAQLLVVTEDEKVQDCMQDELNHLRKHATQVTHSTFEQDDRRVPLGVKLAARALKSMF